MSEQPPSSFGPYRTIEPIGRGGMGVVYRGEDDGGRQVAIKSLEGVEGAELDAVRAIRREVEFLKGLRHPHIVNVVGADLAAKTPWYAMEYVSGPSLSNLIDQDPSTAETLVDTPLATLRTPADGEDPVRIEGRGVAGWDTLTRNALAWLAQIAHALAYLHGEGLIHGDLKPHNIVVSGERAVLVDFGLADRVEGRITLAGLRRAQSSAHTPGYASPECLRSERLDPRADLYSLGCMIYEIVAGRLPFEGSGVEVMFAHLKQEPIPLSTLVEDIPPQLDMLVDRLLAKERRDRCGHALDIVATLAAIGIDPTADEPLPPVRPYLYPAPIVGRDDQIDAIVERVRNVRSDPGTVLITGESGVGKSTLALEAVRAASHHKYRIIATSGTRFGDATDDDPLVPFAAFSGVFDDIVDFARTGFPREVQEVLDTDAIFLAAFEPRLEPWCDREVPVLKDPIGAACRSLRAVLTRMCELNGMVLVCDEVQWFDPASMQALRLLFDHAAEQPWLIVSLIRTGEFDLEAHEFLRRSADVIELTALTEEQTGLSVAGILGIDGVDPDVARLVHSRCEGNPYYVREFMNVALTEGAVELTAAGSWTGSEGRPLSESLAGVPEPESVAELTRRRLSALDPDAFRVAHHAAVVGREFSVWHLSTALHSLGAEAVDRALNTLRTRDIVESTTHAMVMRFAHDRLREGLLDLLEDDARRDAHRAVGQAMAQSDADPAVTAWHFEQAGALAQATTQWLKAVDTARGRQSKAEVASLLQHAIRTGEDVLAPETLRRLRADRVGAVVNSEDHPTAMAEARTLLREELSATLRGEVLTHLATSQWRTGAIEGSLDSTEEALELLDEAEEPERFATALVTHADAADVAGRGAEAIDIYLRALAIADHHGLPSLRVRILNNIGLVYRGLGDYARAITWISQGVDLARETGDRWREALLTSNLGWLYDDQGHTDRSLTEYDRALAIADEIGDAPAAALTRQRLGLLHLKRSNFREALHYLALTERYYRSTEMTGTFGYSLINQASARLQQGRFDEAESLVRRGLALVEGRFVGDEVYALQILGRIDLHAQRWDRAEASLERALGLSEQLGSEGATSWALRDLSMLHSYRGDAARAVELGERARGLAEKGSSVSLVADATLAIGAALHRDGRPEEGLQELERAYQAFVDQERRWPAALAASEGAFAAHGAAGESSSDWLERAKALLEDLELEETALPWRIYRHARDLAHDG